MHLGAAALGLIDSALSEPCHSLRLQCEAPVIAPVLGRSWWVPHKDEELFQNINRNEA